MKFDFTDGEWYQSNFIDQKKYSNMPDSWKEKNRIEEKRRVYSKNGRLICRCESNWNDIEQDHANARLISCAPKMIKALIEIQKLACKTCKDWTENEQICDICHVNYISIIEKALDKKWSEINE